MRAGLLLLLWCGLAIAQPPPPTKNKSTELFEEGRALASAGKHAEACEKFEQSFAIDRAPGTALNYGDCLEHLGQLRKAWRMYDAAARDFTRDKDSRATFARERATKVTARLASILIKVADPAIPGLVIKVGDVSIAPYATINEWFEPGEIEVTATAPNLEPFSSRANALAGSSVIVEIPAKLGAGNGGGVVGPFIGAPVETDGPRNRTRVRIALITGGVGIAAVATSLLLGNSAKSMYDDALDDPALGCMETGGEVKCSEPAGVQKISDAGTRADIATGFAVGGGVLVVAGAVLYFTAPRERIQVAPAASSTAMGVTISGAF